MSAAAHESHLLDPNSRAAFLRGIVLACVVLPQRSHAYVYGSEGGGLTALLEAMAMGKPVVATERAILRLGDQELAQRLGSAARARIERAHTTRLFARNLAPLLRSVV
jgi:hypothetical protein